MRQDLGWDTLLQRRDQARLSMMYRIAHQQVDIPAEQYLTPLDNTTCAIQTDPNFIRRLPTKFNPQNDCTVESTLARSSEPANAGGLPDPAGHPHTLNHPQMFLTYWF